MLETVAGPRLENKFPALYGNRKFITGFTRARHTFRHAYIIFIRALGSVVVKTLRYWFEGPGIDPSHVTGDFFPNHPTSSCARGV